MAREIFFQILLDLANQSALRQGLISVDSFRKTFCPLFKPLAFSDKLYPNIRISKNFQKNKTGECMDLWRQEKYNFLINIWVHWIPEGVVYFEYHYIDRMIICILLSIFLCLYACMCMGGYVVKLCGWACVGGYVVKLCGQVCLLGSIGCIQEIMN